MSEEQVRPATPVVGGSESTGAPIPTGAPVAQATQPDAGKVEPKTQPQPAAAATVDWESTMNPYRARYDGIQSTFKQVKSEADQMRARLQAIEAQQQTLEAERARQAQDFERARIERLLEGDGDTLKSELQRQLTMQKAVEEWQRANVPAIRQQLAAEIQAQVHGQYTMGFLEALEDAGLTRDEANEVLKQVGPDVRAFTKGTVKKAVEKGRAGSGGVASTPNGGGVLVSASPDITALQESVKALQQQILAMQREGSPSPDTTSGSPPSGNDDATFKRRYAHGEANTPEDHRRAKQLLGL